MRQVILTIVLVVAALVVFLLVLSSDYFSLSSEVIRDEDIIYVGKTPIRVEVAETPEELSRGLGGRESLPPEAGLVLRFPPGGDGGIWMRDMKIPIDVIWVGADDTVVDVAENLRPESFPEIFRPRSPARYAIEVNAGFVSTHNIEIGETVRSSAFETE